MPSDTSAIEYAQSYALENSARKIKNWKKEGLKSSQGLEKVSGF